MTLYKKYYGRVFPYRGVWKISVQHNGKRKTFYSSLPGESGHKDCTNKVIAWIADGAPLTPKKIPTVDEVYTSFLADKALETSDIYNLQNRYKNHTLNFDARLEELLSHFHSKSVESPKNNFRKRLCLTGLLKVFLFLLRGLKFQLSLAVV